MTLYFTLLLFQSSQVFISYASKIHLKTLEYKLTKRVANNVTVIGALKITTFSLIPYSIPTL